MEKLEDNLLGDYLDGCRWMASTCTILIVVHFSDFPENLDSEMLWILVTHLSIINASVNNRELDRFF